MGFSYKIEQILKKSSAIILIICVIGQITTAMITIYLINEKDFSKIFDFNEENVFNYTMSIINYIYTSIFLYKGVKIIFINQISTGNYFDLLLFLILSCVTTSINTLLCLNLDKQKITFLVINGVIFALMGIFSYFYYSRNIIWFLGSVTEYVEKNKCKSELLISLLSNGSCLPKIEICEQTFRFYVN